VTGVEELRDAIRTIVTRLGAEAALHDHAASQRLGLGGTDSRFLALLSLHGPLTPGRLAALTGLTTGSVTGVIDRLERGGFVRRERDSTDRRRVRVVREPAAVARLAAEYAERVDTLEAAMRRREPAELAVIARFLAELAGGDGAGR
jgi:DNA-binding MarR family transcriptional regulator